MTHLDAFRSAGLEINWRTIAIGWDGPGKWPRLLTSADVQSVAAAALSNQDPANEAELVDIVATSADDVDDIDRRIHRLAEASNADPERELRKWRVILLKDQLWKIPRDPLYGLLALTEFWEKFGFPADSPHIVQGRGNAVAPNEYYSEDNFRRLLQQHATWMDSELRDLGGAGA